MTLTVPAHAPDPSDAPSPEGLHRRGTPVAPRLPRTPPTPQQPLLACRGLVARAGAFRLGPIDLAVGAGEVCCLLGPNGAGKTTLLRSLLALQPIVDGARHIADVPVTGRDERWLRAVGVVPDDPTELVEELTAAEYWSLVASTNTARRRHRLAMVARARTLAARLDFDPDPRALIAGYSHGMRKKTQLVAALMHAPSLLVLDEPRNGLDPAGIAMLEELVADHCARGGGVLAATHDLHWADRIATRLTILTRGRCGVSTSKRDLAMAGVGLVDLFFRVTGEPATTADPATGGVA